jgi:hypothetical protein
MRRNLSISFIALMAWATHPVSAHHSYSDYDRTERYELRGTLTEVHWANPHIVFTVNDGERDIRIEWVTITGAEKTAATRDQFVAGEEVVVIGSRNRDPGVHIMTVIKEVRLPGKNWQWLSPGGTPSRP